MESCFRNKVLDITFIKKMFERQNANDTKKRCNIHSEKKFVLPKEINDTNNSSACWLSLMYDGKVLTIGVINVLNSTL